MLVTLTYAVAVAASHDETRNWNLPSRTGFPTPDAGAEGTATRAGEGAGAGATSGAAGGFAISAGFTAMVVGCAFGIVLSDVVRVDAVFVSLSLSSPKLARMFTTTMKATTAPQTFQIVPGVFLPDVDGWTCTCCGLKPCATLDDLGNVEAVHCVPSQTY